MSLTMHWEPELCRLPHDIELRHAVQGAQGGDGDLPKTGTSRIVPTSAHLASANCSANCYNMLKHLKTS